MRTALLPLAAVVTPNLPEAEALAGMAIRSDARRRGGRATHRGARAARPWWSRAGTPTRADIVDVLFDGVTVRRFPQPRIPGSDTHGTGCTFAAAVAAHLALGRSLADAVPVAQRYIARGHRRRAGARPGPRADGPLLAGAARPQVRMAVSAPGTLYLKDGCPRPIVAVTSNRLDLEALTAAVASGPAPTARWRRLPAWCGRRTWAAGWRTWNTRHTSRWRCGRCSASWTRRWRHWPGARVGVHHRIGRLELGEASIVIAAASAHRADAFAACRYTIERVKQIVPIWKHEHFDGGDVWLEGATADPDDETARQTAYRIACA